MRGATHHAKDLSAVEHISIHAPHAGCDLLESTPIFEPKLFQSTHPMRGATPRYLITPSSKLFQSTHPMRGATHLVPFFRIFYPISIHAPHAGCDPRRYPHKRPYGISIHAPQAGCDPDGARVGILLPISIHAPHAGCDFTQEDVDRIVNISIHAPHAGCDRDGARPAQNVHISIHAPHAGCDVAEVIIFTIVFKFQSTHPMRGATPRFAHAVHLDLISIHAPHAGCDPIDVIPVIPILISIHAPHAGCDSKY